MPIVELLVAWFIVILEGVFTKERKHKSITDYIPFKAMFEFLIASNGNVWGIICIMGYSLHNG